MFEKKTAGSWRDELIAPGARLTLAEFQAGEAWWAVQKLTLLVETIDLLAKQLDLMAARVAHMEAVVARTERAVDEVTSGVFLPYQAQLGNGR